MKPSPKTNFYPVFFAPDLDISWMANPGLLIDVTNYIPTKRNTFKTHQCAPLQQVTSSANAIGGDYLSGGIFKNVAGTGRLIIGTTLYLLESVAGVWTLRKTLGATASGFDFCTYGNEIFAVDKANPPQMSSSTTFADVAGSPPKASCCATSKNFVILGDTDDGVDDLGDRVWWSALGDPTDWSPSAATQAGNLRITDTPGPIKALVNMRDGVAVYKDDALYMLEYQNATLLWTPRLISDKAGCSSRTGVAVVNGIHYFLHRTGVKRFDGASVQDIGAPVNRYLFDKMASQSNFATVQAAYDEYENVVLWFFNNPNSANVQDRSYALAYNVVTGRFGFVQEAWTGDGTGSSGYCQGVLPVTLSDIASWDSSLGGSIGNTLTIGVDGDGNKAILRIPAWGTAGPSISSALNLTTGDIGDDVSDTTLMRVQPRLLQSDPNFGSTSSFKCGVATKKTQSEDYGSQTFFTTDSTRRRFDGTISARYMQVVMPIYNYGEIAGLYLTTQGSGTE